MWRLGVFMLETVGFPEPAGYIDLFIACHITLQKYITLHMSLLIVLFTCIRLRYLP